MKTITIVKTLLLMVVAYTVTCDCPRIYSAEPGENTGLILKEYTRDNIFPEMLPGGFEQYNAFLKIKPCDKTDELIRDAAKHYKASPLIFPEYNRVHEEASRERIRVDPKGNIYFELPLWGVQGLLIVYKYSQQQQRFVARGILP